MLEFISMQLRFPPFCDLHDNVTTDRLVSNTAALHIKVNIPSMASYVVKYASNSNDI